jgi:hypothetical protein
VGANVKFYLDGVLRLDCTDDSPLDHGSIAFQTVEDSHAQFDDVEVVSMGTAEPGTDRR